MLANRYALINVHIKRTHPPDANQTLKVLSPKLYQFLPANTAHSEFAICPSPQIQEQEGNTDFG